MSIITATIICSFVGIVVGGWWAIYIGGKNYKNIQRYWLFVLVVGGWRTVRNIYIYIYIQKHSKMRYLSIITSTIVCSFDGIVVGGWWTLRIMNKQLNNTFILFLELFPSTKIISCWSLKKINNNQLCWLTDFVAYNSLQYPTIFSKMLSNDWRGRCN